MAGTKHSNEDLKHSNASSITVPYLALSSFPSAVPHIKHLRKLHFTNVAKTKYMIMAIQYSSYDTYSARDDTSAT